MQLLQYSNDIENATQYLTSVIQEGAWRSTPQERYERREGMDYSREVMALINT